ncbi:hypothetical protein F4821DRAFT_261121 [Hypoxylon rubiginosum]|uniref:Uncharacterized protein n=1 Tax=Hypoxylon rubiginosum TaxID=110542 RepID=A0ACC0CXW8_9PEZI|nr:hypothetical protein F4821DRAFT_261121 [Hypoxylon rubiginosum]
MSDDYHIFKFETMYGSVYLVSGVALDELIIPERDHIFLFHAPENVSIPLVLREHSTVPNDDLPVSPPSQDSDYHIWRIPPKQFRLVGACLYAFLGTYFRESALYPHDHLGCVMSEDLEIPDPVDLFDTETRFTHLPFLHRARTVGLPQVQTPYSILERCHELLDRPIPSNIMYEIGGAFLNEAMKDTAKSTGSLLYWALLPLVVNLGPATTSLFEESYLSYFDPKYEPKADDDFLQVNVPLIERCQDASISNLKKAPVRDLRGAQTKNYPFQGSKNPCGSEFRV